MTPDQRTWLNSQDNRYYHAADAFVNYDFGEQVKDIGTWQHESQDEWSLPVYLENGDEPSVKVTFVVRFTGDQVVESYIAG